MSEYLSAYKNKTVEALFLEKYDLCLKLWPVPYEEEYIETELGPTYVIKCGNKEGPVLVLLHGKAATSALWSPNITELTQKYYIIAIDIPSDINKTRFKKPFESTGEAADWLIGVIDRLGIDKFSLMGCSYGSFFAMNLSVLEQKRVESLIIIAPSISFTNIRKQLWYWAIKMILSPFDSTKMKFLEWINAGKPLRVPKDFTDLLIMGIKYANVKVKPLIHVFSDKELSQIKIPVLLLIGQKEVMTEIDDVVARATRVIKNLKCQIIEDAGHTLAMDKPEVVNPIVQSFLNGVHAGIKS